MIDKEKQYRKEMLSLFREDLETISNDKDLIQIIEDIFISDNQEINNESILRKLIK